MDGYPQVLVDQRYASEGDAVTYGVIAQGQVSFQVVSHGVHASGRRNLRRQAERQFRVFNREARDEMWAEMMVLRALDFRVITDRAPLHSLSPK